MSSFNFITIISTNMVIECTKQIYSISVIFWHICRTISNKDLHFWCHNLDCNSDTNQNDAL